MKIYSIDKIIKEKSRNIWSKIVDNELLKETKFFIKDNVAIIYSKNSIIANEINNYKLFLLDKIKKYNEKIKDIEVKINPKMFLEDRVIINKSEREFKIILQEKRKKYEKIFSSEKDENLKKYFVSFLALKEAREEIIKNKGGKICKNCHEYFLGVENICVICENEIIEEQKNKIIDILNEDTEITKEYIIKIKGFKELAYKKAKNEILVNLFKIIEEKYKNKLDYTEELNKYSKILTNSNKKVLLDMKKEKVNERLNTLFGEKNE